MAFVCWILFDEQFKYVASSSGYEQVGDDDEFKIHTLNDIVMNKNGYLFVYVSNASESQPVYFDNLQVTHIRGPILEETHFYPGGMVQPNRQYRAGDYRYGLNGKEMDSEVKGSGAQYDYGFRIYDPRIVRFLSVDPLFKSYPWYTPYQYAGNTPIQAVDVDGREELIVIRWFDNGKYKGESFFRINNVDQRDLDKKAGNDMQLIELPASQMKQFEKLIDSKDIEPVLDYLLVPNKGVFKGKHFESTLKKYQGVLEVLRRKDQVQNSSSYAYPLPLEKETVFFMQDKKDVNVKLSPEVLETIKDKLQDDEELKISIVGFASIENGTTDANHNDKLSKDRAEAVKAYLIKNGIKEERILSVEGAGATDQFNKSDTEEGRSQNRRAEITFTYAKTQ